MTSEREAELATGAASTCLWKSVGLPEIQLQVPPTVYPPREDSELLDEAVRTLGPGKGRRLLEIGCGSGAISISAAMRGWMVEACDVNPLAVAATIGNAENCACSDRLKVREGGPAIELDKQWLPARPVDLICWNLPYLELEIGAERLGPLEEAGLVDAKSRDETISCNDSLIRALMNSPQLLNPHGVILLVHSDNRTGGEVGCSWLRAGWASRVLNSSQIGQERLVVTVVWRPFEGVAIQHLDAVDSTNDLILQSAYPVGTLITAKSQKKGRGQHGRVWESPEGGFFGSWSIDIESIKHGSARLQIGAALAVADTISATLRQPLPSHGWKWANHLTEKGVFIKWPNDLWISSTDGIGKFAGILGESRSKGDLTTIALGIGVNLQAVQQASLPISSLSEITEDCPDQLQFSLMLHASIASRFETPSILNPIAGDWGKPVAWQLMQPLTNSSIELELDGSSMPVSIIGLTESGELLLRDQSGAVHCIDSTESLRWLTLHPADS